MIRLDSPGPVIFRQVRIGQDLVGTEIVEKQVVSIIMREIRGETEIGEKWIILDLCLLCTSFEPCTTILPKRFPELFDFEGHEENTSGLYLAKQKDSRVTRIGRFLRRTSLDELPNLINIVLGHMVLVGPRPEIVAVVKYYKEWEKLKFKVKPVSREWLRSAAGVF